MDMRFSTSSSSASAPSGKTLSSAEDSGRVNSRQAEVEYLENYRPGGFHPIHIGDKIGDGRYEIVHKLGYGGSSTVWLAHEHGSGRYVKLKILSSWSSNSGHEVKCLKHLRTGSNDQVEHPGKRYVPFLFDTFTFEGPNGNHQCVVMEIAGCSLAYTKEHAHSGQFKADVGRAIAARTLLGLAYIHSKGMIHGDLHVGNILLRNPEISGSAEEIYQKYGCPEETPIERVDGKSPRPEAPLYTVSSMDTAKSAERVWCTDIMISDFGEASILPYPNSGNGTPMHARPPEFHLKLAEEYGQPADIWTAACTIYHILGTVPLFSVCEWNPAGMMNDIARLLGPLPKDLMERWKLVLESAPDEWGRYLLPPWEGEYPERSMEDALAEMSYGSEGNDYTEEELRDLADLLLSMLKYRPSERVTADEACQSAWMQKWGLPAITRTDG